MKRFLYILLASCMVLGLGVSGMAAVADDDIVGVPETAVLAAGDFADVPPDFWAYEDIMYMVELGIINCTSDTEFTPEGEMSRAMFVTLLGRTYEAEGGVVDERNDTFDDTEDGAYYAKYVAWAVENGLVEGVGGNRFAPDDSVSREQAAVLIARYAEFRSYSGLETTADALAAYSDRDEISSWATDAMAWCVSNGYITGTSPTTLSPLQISTRAECATLFARFLRAYGVEGGGVEGAYYKIYKDTNIASPAAHYSLIYLDGYDYYKIWISNDTSETMNAFYQTASGTSIRMFTVAPNSSDSWGGLSLPSENRTQGNFIRFSTESNGNFGNSMFTWTIATTAVASEAD